MYTATLHRLFVAIMALLICLACGDTTPADTPLLPPDNDATEEEPQAESYTIMYYACGGSTLDNGIEIVLRSTELVNISKTMAVTASVKWSAGRINKICNSDGGVFRFHLSSANSELEPMKIGDKEYPIHSPESIADFILWSREVAPADNYILVLAGHGNGWHPGVGLNDTRGTVRDTDLDRYISLRELNEGIALSGAHFRMISFNSCLMNTMEYLTELSDDADYLLAPNHVSVLLGSELSFLVTCIGEEQPTNERGFINAMKSYIEEMAQQLELYSNEDRALDLVLSNSSNIAELNKAIKGLTDTIIRYYDEEMEIGPEAMATTYGGTIADLERALSGAYSLIDHGEDDEEMEYMRQSFTYDIVDIAKRAAMALPTAEMIKAYEEVTVAATDCREIYYTQQLSDIEDIFYAVTLTNSELWVEREYEKAGYLETSYDKSTGWSRFLKRNGIELR